MNVKQFGMWVLWATLGQVQLASATEPEQAKSPWHIEVILDTYYQVDLARPKSGALLAGRADDVVIDHFELANAQLNVERKPTAGSPWGMTLSLTAGRDADLTHLTEPAGSSKYETFLQAYASYLIVGKKPVMIDVGKFLPTIGYESTNTYENDNYGGSALSSMGQPAYHFGIRASVPLSPSTNLTAYVVNGWNEVEDSNGGKSLGLTANWNPNAKTGFSLNWLGGDEGGKHLNDAGSYGGIGFAGPGVRRTQLWDAIATFQATDKLSWAFDACYVQADGTGGASSGRWKGGLVAAKYVFSPSWSGVLRVDTFQDEQGLLAGSPVSIDGFTGTLIYSLKGGSQLKLEYRHENANSPFYQGVHGPSQYRDTIAFAQIVRF